MQKFNYHTHTYRCGHAQFDMEDEEYKTIKGIRNKKIIIL